MRFARLAEYLEKLEGTSSRLAMTEILASLYKEADASEMREVVYLCQGKLGPAYKSPDFGVADKQVIKLIKRLSDEDVEKVFKETGDLGKTVEKLKEKDAGKNSKLSVKDVYDKLWKVAETSGTGSQEGKSDQIVELLSGVDPRSAKYVVKIILGKLRSGFSDMTALDGLSWMLSGDKKLRPEIEALYDVRADLGELARLIKENDGIKGLKVEPVIGTPILMAKAERATTADEIWEREARAMEYKLDGLRIQAHIRTNKPGSFTAVQDDNVQLFSRGMEDVTAMYPDVVEGLTKQIKKDCIVEGEMIALGKNGEFLPFQETTQRKRKYDIEEMRNKIPLTIFLFDSLVLDKTNMTNRT
ncbi:MAG: DNA ligase, partial [Patescibacteria group bacterium]